MDLIVRGGALPTFLLERIAAATRATAVDPQPPQTVVFRGACGGPAFDALIPLIEAERLIWSFAEGSGPR